MSSPTTMTTRRGRVIGLALKTSVGGPMKLHERLPLNSDIGLDGVITSKGYRQVTLISSEHWREVQEELGEPLPWYERRANVLTQGIDLRRLIGATICLGTAVLSVLDELEPCKRMNDIHPRLFELLRPDIRGGVFCRIEECGSVRVGDEIRVLAGQALLDGAGESFAFEEVKR